MSASLYTKRRIKNIVAMVLSVAATAIGLFFLAWILWETLSQGASALKPQLFTKITAYREEGGLANAMVGSLILNFLGILIATPIGVARPSASSTTSCCRHRRSCWVCSFTRSSCCRRNTCRTAT
jgi:phosphate transport system permease protein